MTPATTGKRAATSPTSSSVTARSFFFDDHNVPGHDVRSVRAATTTTTSRVATTSVVAGPGVEKIAGAAGFDWSIGLGDPQAQYADLNLVRRRRRDPAIEVRDSFNEVEALSGWNLDDTLRGDDVVPTAVGGGGFIGCDALDPAGVARISGLDPLVTAADARPRLAASPDVIANTSTHHACSTGNVWGEGNILLGGGGSDTHRRSWRRRHHRRRPVRQRAAQRPYRPANPASRDRLHRPDGHACPRPATSVPERAGMTLQQAVFAGLVDPGNIVTVREILTSSTPDTDVALFSGPRTNYEITVAVRRRREVITVTDTVGPHRRHRHAAQRGDAAVHRCWTSPTPRSPFPHRWPRSRRPQRRLRAQ